MEALPETALVYLSCAMVISVMDLSQTIGEATVFRVLS